MIARAFLLLLSSSVIAAYNNWAASNCQINQLVVFGAGYEDDGVSEPDDLVGIHKYSTGKVWPQYLAGFMKMSLRNDAVAGGTSGYDNLYFPGFSGNKWQVDNYLKSNPQISKNVIFGVGSGGINEMFDLQYGEAKLNAMVNNITEGLGKLAKAGAKTIFVLNLPDYTLAPAFKNGSKLEPTSSRDVEKASTKAAILNHNAKMTQALVGLGQKNPTTKFIEIDFHTYWEAGIKSQPYQTTYGFACGEGLGIKNSESGLEMPADIYAAGTAKFDDMLKYAFYDAYHPASGVHKYIAEKIKSRLCAEGVRPN